jgi:hypothetical protein
MTRIRPPRKPKGEDLAVTIANQDKQIVLLLDRIEDLRKERNVWEHDCKQAEGKSDFAQLEILELKTEIEAVKSANTRLLGYQDCAKKIIEMFIDK